ncbi:peptide/nickel transport system permease protein [Pollutimonas bauzanensis]|uniref:Peptide/nickel transport system permease protein n=1 Tax=Pollutimonas bauzanensis TaxID=658167 RepID=A0A1M5XWJ5_9BURK|nr:peptide/nickel transport system permease protein [Pollutimonas bauzanensis]
MLLLMCVAGALAVFLTMQAAPGDPALVVLGEQANPEAVAAYRAAHYLDDPALVQFLHWGRGLLTGDFGLSLSVAKGQPVAGLVGDRLPNTLFIGAYAMLLALAFSLIAGTLAARNRGNAIDVAATSVAVLGISMPDFWLAYVLVFVFALTWQIFPAYGFITPSTDMFQALHSGFLPALAVSAPLAAVFTRILRVSLIENQSKDYVRAARSFGFSQRFVFLHYVLRNALVPFVTIVGIQARYLLGGTVVVERVFGIPGLGSLMVDAAFARDYPVVQACALVFLVCILLVNFVVDLVCQLLDPRGQAG